MSSSLRTATLVVLALWAVVTVVCLMAPRGHGLTARYDARPEREIDALDPQISSHQILKQWRAAPPQVFSVHWGGYVHVARDAQYTFATHSDDPSRVYVDGRLVVDNPGQPRNTDREVDGEVATAEATGDMQLESGPHSIVIQYFHDGGDPVFEWSWGRDGAAQEPVPSWALSPTSSNLAAFVMPAALRVWWLTSTAALLLVAASWAARVTARGESDRVIWMAVRIALFSVLAWLYVVGATEHARVVNTSKARADQSGYLWDAQQVYANQLGRQPPKLIGERMRMPVYAGLLTTIYSNRLSDMAFFEEAKLWNIKLSLVLLAFIAIVIAWHLPPLPATALTLAIAFGYFVFRAGYTQPELLFYTLFFFAFITSCRLIVSRRRIESLVLGAASGVLLGLAFLTKALVPPFFVLVLLVLVGQETLRLVQGTRDSAAKRDFAWRTASAALMGVSFLAVTSPYLLNSKREFGSYFYNVNTAVYMWYDDGATARAELLPQSDDEGRIRVPPERLPSLRTYLQTRSVGQIAQRVIDGLKDTAVRSYSTSGFLKYVAMYVAFAIVLMAMRPRQVADLIRERWVLVTFLLAYAAIYLPATAFFVPTSSTGAIRFLLAHVAPLLFSLAWFFTRPAFAVPARVFHVMVLLLLAVDLGFLWWPRMMTTYAGF